MNELNNSHVWGTNYMCTRYGTNSIQLDKRQRDVEGVWNGCLKFSATEPRRTKEEKVSQIDRIKLTVLNNKRYGYNEYMRARWIIKNKNENTHMFVKKWHGNMIAKTGHADFHVYMCIHLYIIFTPHILFNNTGYNVI